MSFLYLRGLFLIFPSWLNPLYNTSPSLFNIFHSSLISTHLPGIAWINTIIFLFFLISFSSEVKGIDSTPLKKSVQHAIIGISVFLLIQTLLIAMQIIAGGLGWMLPLSFWISALLFPLFMVVFVLKFNFFLNFYKILTD
jgi:hypothetical protein